MKDDLEDQISQMLAHRATQFTETRMPAMIDGAIKHGQVRRRRQQVAGGFAAAALLVVAVPLAGQMLNDDKQSVVIQPAASPPPASQATAPPSNVTPRVNTTPCGSVKAPPKGIEVDTTNDPENGVLEFWYRDYRDSKAGVDRHYAIDYRNDPTCRDNPRLRALIEHAEEASRAG